MRDVSLRVHRGERVGIAGLVGSGRSELLRLLYGADVADAGELSLKGAVRPPFAHPAEALAAGVAMLTEDRKTDGLLLEQPVQVNVTLASLPSRGGVLDLGEERRRANMRLAELQTRYRDVKQPAAELSGGNQQKVALARWLEADADLLLLDEPTRGIDVAARLRIHRLLEDFSRTGKGLVVVSSDVDELMAVCDTILAYAEGRIVGRFQRGSWTRQAIIEAAFERYPSQTASGQA